MSEKANKILYIALSLLMAVIFWLYVDREEGSRISATFPNIPVEFIGETDVLAGRGLMLENGQDVSITLRLSGPRTVISSLEKEDIRIWASVTSISAIGTYQLTYDIEYPDDINRSDISMESQSQFSVTVQVVELSNKTVPVTWEVTGEVADSYIYMSDLMVLEPSTITISGREEDIAPVETAHIVLDMSGANSTVERELEYQMLDADGNEVVNESIRVSEHRVAVTAPVYLIKDLDLVVRWLSSPGSLEEDISYTIGPVDTITVAGEPASRETKDEIVLGEIDLSEYVEGTSLDFDINIPANCVNISGITTASVSFQFKAGLDTRLFTVTDISYRGLSDGYRCSLVTTSLNVVLRGPTEVMEALTEENLRVVVDLSDYNTDGTHRVEPLILVDGFDNVGAVGPYIVTCRVSS